MVIQETEKMIMGTLHERKKEKQNKKKIAEKSLISFQMMPKILVDLHFGYSLNLQTELSANIKYPKFCINMDKQCILI